MERKTAKIDAALKEAEISKHVSDVKINETGKDIEKIEVLSDLLQAVTIDGENTIISSEPKWKSVFDHTDQERIKDKIFEIINRL